jgi:GntR family transcriptional regulator
VEPVGGGSLAFRAREAILHSILEQKFEDSRLPPENELAEMLGVSRTTVRSALQSLEQHGVLTRSPRRGTKVDGHMSPSLVALQRLIGFARLLEEQGYSVRTTTKVTTAATPPIKVVEALGISKRSSCYEIDRLLVASGQPAIWAIDYFPTEFFSEPPRIERAGQSPFDMADLLVGGPIDHALVELVPSKASKEVVERLRLKPAEAYILLREVHFSESGKALGFSLIHVNDRFVRFHLRRGGNGL